MPIAFQPCGPDAVSAKLGHTEVILRFRGEAGPDGLEVRVVHWRNREFSRRCYVSDRCPCLPRGGEIPESCEHWASFYLPSDERGFGCNEPGEARSRLAAMLGYEDASTVTQRERVDGYGGGENFEGARDFLAQPWFVRGTLYGAP